MALVKHIENNLTFYLFPLNKTLDGKTAFLDATNKVKDGKARDRKNGYKAEQGPHYGIEILRAQDYADYVSSAESVSADNLNKFSTKGYSFFLTGESDEIVRERSRRKVSAQSNVSK